jgi:hypothetical protein
VEKILYFPAIDDILKTGYRYNVNIGKHPEREAPPKMQASTYISMLSMGVSENASLGI